MAPSGKGKRDKKAATDGKDKNGRPAKQKKVKEVVFDADSRKEYLTGFSKRKKAKQTAKRNKAIEREREELRKMRTQIREQRKEQAAHNVKMAKMAYGDAGSGSDDEEGSGDEDLDSDASSGSENEDDSPETAYETADALTTVSVAPLSLSRSASPEPFATSGSPPPPAAPREDPKPVQQTSVYKKRVRGTVQARPKLTKQDRKKIVEGGKGVKKQMLHRMKGTKARSLK
ncbi:hypothetical protein JCM10213_008496 [Rhodosporidiobolus nylandii]